VRPKALSVKGILTRRHGDTEKIKMRYRNHGQKPVVVEVTHMIVMFFFSLRVSVTPCEPSLSRFGLAR